jgi:hypothetical protein
MADGRPFVGQSARSPVIELAMKGGGRMVVRVRLFPRRIFLPEWSPNRGVVSRLARHVQDVELNKGGATVAGGGRR